MRSSSSHKILPQKAKRATPTVGWVFVYYTRYWCKLIFYSPSMKCIRALFSVCLSCCCCEIAIRVGESDERDQSAPARTAPQQAGFELYWASACCGYNSATRGRTSRGYGIFVVDLFFIFVYRVQWTQLNCTYNNSIWIDEGSLHQLRVWSVVPDLKRGQ